MTLAYEVAGDGPGLVLLHSTVCDRRMWDAQWKAFVGGGFRVVRCDFPGFGQSPVPDKPWNEADEVIALLDELGMDDFSLVGSSHGGNVAQQIAARWPSRVTKLALVCSAMQGHEPTSALRDVWQGEEECIEAGDVDGAVEVNLEAFLGPEASAAAREHVRAMQRLAFDVQLAAEAEAAAEAGEAAPLDVAADLSAITASCLIVQGEKDLPDFVQIARRLEEVLPTPTRSVWLPWAGHLPTIERPQELETLLLEFLGGAGQAGARTT